MSLNDTLLAVVVLAALLGPQACRNVESANPPNPFDTSSDTDLGSDIDSDSDTDTHTDSDSGIFDTDTFDTETFDTDTGTVVPCIYDCISPLYSCGNRGQNWHMEMECPPGEYCCELAKNHLTWQCLICDKVLPFD